MLLKIKNNKPDGIFSQDFINDNFTNVINGELVSEWILTNIFPNENYIKPFWNGSEWIEGATPEEIAAQQQVQALEQAKQFLANNKTAGEDYYNNINLRVTVALFALEKNVLFPILQEVDDLLYPPLNKIKTGDFASALFIFSNQQPPTNQFVLDFYNEAVAFCKNYYDTKYPK